MTALDSGAKLFVSGAAAGDVTGNEDCPEVL